MENETLVDLWADTLLQGYNTRKNGLDGLKSWQPLKQKYEKMYVIGYENGIPVNAYFSFMVKDKYIIGSDKLDHKDSIFKIDKNYLANGIEPHHFYIQHFRIPNLESNKLSVLKLLQIAYNAGQFKAELEKNNSVYATEFVDFYKNNKLDQIDTYIDAGLANIIPMTKLTGGVDNSYHKKYIKYKLKYLNAK